MQVARWPNSRSPSQRAGGEGEKFAQECCQAGPRRLASQLSMLLDCSRAVYLQIRKKVETNLLVFILRASGTARINTL
ncbi:hypothetical protein BZY99_08660 [Pectobacterium versatile]|nr:hypothetical protein BZY99_08660 [Pectobacterium versatile]